MSNITFMGADAPKAIKPTTPPKPGYRWVHLGYHDNSADGWSSNEWVQKPLVELPPTDAKFVNDKIDFSLSHGRTLETIYKVTLRSLHDFRKRPSSPKNDALVKQYEVQVQELLKRSPALKLLGMSTEGMATEKTNLLIPALVVGGGILLMTMM